MAAAQYKLTYFPIRALAEPIRYMFAAAGVTYEDVRLLRENWPAMKPNTPFGQMPLLEFGGKQYCQSKSICRFLGSQFNLAPGTDAEKLQADMVGDCCEDMRPYVVALIRAKRAEQTQLLKDLGEKFYKEELPNFLQNFEKFLNGSSDEYFACSNLTWVDIYFVGFIEFVASIGKANGGDWDVCLDQYPKLTAHRDRVLANKGIAAWREKRPVTDV